MIKIASKLAELSQRALELEAQIARQGRQQDPFLGDHTRRHRAYPEPLGHLQKRLASLRRSCEILARHLTPETHPRAVPSALRRSEDVTAGRRATAGV